MSGTNITLADVHNGKGTMAAPTSETFLTDMGNTGDSTDATVNGVWDTRGPSDQIEFTSTDIVTQEDIDNLQ